MEHVDREWRKSTYSGSNGGGCVETASTTGRVLVRDSKLADSPVITFSSDDWQRLTDQLRHTQ